MELVMDEHEVEAIVYEFDELTQNPEIFIEPQLQKSERFKQLLKKIYKYTVASNSVTKLKAKSLVKLLVEGFDEEQIWQQIEIQNKAALPHFSNSVPTIKPCNVSFGIHRTTSNRKPAVIRNESSDDDVSKIKEDYVFDDDSVSSTEIVKAIKKRTINDSNDDEDFAFDDDSDSSEKLHETNQKMPVPRKKTALSYKSEVDDQFFKLSNLEEFLKLEDLKEENKDKNLSDEEDNINLFEDVPSDDMDEFDDESDNEERSKKLSRDLMYKDFFDMPESGDESIDGQEDLNKIMSDDENDNQSEDISADDMENDNEVDSDMKAVENESSSQMLKEPLDSITTTQKTAFEIEQEKIRKKIEECEKSMLEPMSWHLTGEVAAGSRPVDSLLYQEVEFDTNAKQDLIVDSTLTEKVESIIKLAIINKAFCDVERRYKRTEDIIAYKKEVALDQAKSKKSLAEVYEEDYLKKQKKQEEEEDPKHKEIMKLMDSLFPELHALFTHMPKPAIPEIKIVSNLPAITVEEVAPTCISDVTLLAPEEVKEKSGLVKGTTERTDTDRKRERRKKKIHQKLKEKKKQEKLEKANPSAKMTKLEKLEALKKLKRNKNTKIATVDDGGKIKSSKDFFSRLQDTVDSSGRNKIQVPVKKKKK